MKKPFFWLGAVCASVSLLASVADAASAPATTASVPQKVGYAKGPCDASDVLNLIGKDGELQHDRGAASELIAGRVVGCQFIITKYLNTLPSTPAPITFRKNLPQPPATPPPRPNANCRSIVSSDPIKQYSVLDYCASWIARYVPAGGVYVGPSPTPAPLSNHIGAGATSNSKQRTRVVYVFSLAADMPTSAQTSLQMVEDLRPYLRSAPQPDPFVSDWQDTYTLLAAPGWSLAQYQQQCAGDVNTAGAIVVLPPGTASASWNFLLTGAWTYTTVQAMVLDCEPTSTTYQNSAAYITRVTDVRNGKATRVSFSLATALGLAAGVLAFHPARTNTFAFTSPSPMPPPGSSYQTGYNVAQNSSALGAAAAVGVAALAPLSQTNLGLLPGADAQLRESLQKSLPKLVDYLVTGCSPNPTEDSAEPDLSECQWLMKPGS